MKPSAPDLAGRRVLLVEDESLIIMLVEDTLADLGCEVAGVASRFDDAVTKARTLAFDVAILDVNLNGLRTFPIAEIIQQRGIAFVFATGYGATSVPDGLNAVPILQKPFAAIDLEKALRSALSGTRQH
ncbi:MAG: response regulator [Pseudorhodoplanes sp.]|uniref:response regulator n=1 Tax=Pseudorhodoplanes sp. TaxID=1934341 RepID=UPI003D110FB5